MLWAQIKIKFLTNLFLCLDVISWQSLILLLSPKHTVHCCNGAVMQYGNGAVCYSAVVRWCDAVVAQWQDDER